MTPGLKRRKVSSAAAALATALQAVLATPAVAADPLFAHEQPRYRSGAELLEDCTSAQPVAQARCAGYVMAVADMLGGAAARIDGLQACLKGDETLADLLGVVRGHLERNPARGSLKGDGAVAYALSIYRPCPESGASFEERLLEELSPPEAPPR